MGRLRGLATAAILRRRYLEVTSMAAEPETPTSIDEDKRHVIENAIMAFRPEVKRDPADAPVDPGTALAALAANPTVRRLTKHRRLIDGLLRTKPDQRGALDGAARDVLASTLDPDMSDDQRQLRLDRAKRRLDEMVAREGESQLGQRHWQHWVHNTDDIFRFSTPEQTLAACNDEHLVPKRTRDGPYVQSRLIVAQFWSDLPPAAFREYVQPKYWADCCAFWQSVVPLRGPEVPTTDGYDWDCIETVTIAGQPLTVPLQIGFRELPDHSRVWTRFNLYPGRDYKDPVQVDVDTGTVSAESVPDGPARTLVKATKYVHWREGAPQPDLTAHACDFGWCELMVEMAYRSVREFAPARLQAEETQAAQTRAAVAKTPAGAAVTELAGAVTAECQQVIGDNRANLEKLIGRFTGKSWEAGWINDLLDMGLSTARHYGSIASSVRRFADSLGNPRADSDVLDDSEAPAGRDAQAKGEDDGGQGAGQDQADRPGPGMG
jgi:hypothetical protein